MTQPLYGKFRAIVVDNVDPEHRGRVRVRVPEVGPEYAMWAVPSWPPGSTLEDHHAPDLGADVWVEFEHGDPDYPIWDGIQ